MRRRPSMRVWRYSRGDFALACIAAGQFAATTAWAFTFHRLSLGWNLAAFAVITYAFYYNPVVVTHNFLHTPFFRRRAANRAFAIFNSANLFLPQVLYKYHHLTHHQYANDPVRNGTTLDPSSTYRYGRQGRQEGFVRYCALSLLRDGGTGHAFREAMRHGQRAQFALELAAVLIAGAIWIAIDWRWMLFAYVPMFYFGWFLALLENYFEHHRASDHDSRLADSVS